MRVFNFSKMHGAGNDFIVSEVEVHAEEYIENLSFIEHLIPHLCDRRRGVGADGFILISPPSKLLASKQQTSMPLFKMKYFNNDGGLAEMCGNGLRCAALYAHKYLTNKNGPILFETDAGVLQTEIIDDEKVRIQIPLLKLPQIAKINKKKYFTVNTGVPHLVAPVHDITSIDIVASGRKLRYLDRFNPEGVNVDFISIPTHKKDPISIRTYERGVEEETSACGTGIAASAIVLSLFYSIPSPIHFITKDKDTITIDFCYKENNVGEIQDTHILLTGPAIEVFRGSLEENFLNL